MNIKITVSGPGGCISYEIAHIQSLFESLGCKVIVEDPCPLPKVWSRTEWAAKFGSTTEITLVADHIPWGG